MTTIASQHIKKRRKSKYCQDVIAALSNLKHASNAQLLEVLERTHAEISATTVHRITARLAAFNDIAIAPSTQSGAIRYDINTQPHDHFMCTECGRLRDIDIVDTVLPTLQSQLDGCRVSGRLTIMGVCKKCKGESQ